MAKDFELDLEVLDAGLAHSLYNSALVNLAVTLDAEGELTSRLAAVASRAQVLKDVLVRCGIELEIRVEFRDSREIADAVRTSDLARRISDRLVQHCSHRQEKLFRLASLIAALAICYSGKLPDDALASTQAQAAAVARDIDVPEALVACGFAERTLEPIRAVLQERQRSLTGLRVSIPDDALLSFKIDNPGYERNVFVMMSFAADASLERVWTQLHASLVKRGVQGSASGPEDLREVATNLG